MTMRASLIITAKEQASAALGKVAAGARSVSAAFKPVQREAAAAERSISRVADGSVLAFQRIRVGSKVSFRPMLLTAEEARGTFARLGIAAKTMAGNLRSAEYRGAAFRRAVSATGQSARSAAGGMARWSVSVVRSVRDMRLGTRAAYGLGYAIGWTVRKSAGLALSTAKWGAIGLGGSAAYAGGSFLGGVIRTGAQFEQFAIMLKTVTGSAEAAKASMAWVQKFAASTPYELEEVMASFVKLKTRGLDPTDGTMRSLGDAASAMGKSIDEAVEMMADAVTGEFERLKEFGVIASNAGGKVTFNWMKNGKALTKTVKKDGNEIRKALTEIFDSNYGGAMEGQSKTFTGMISNLKDMWVGFQKKVADAGIFDRVKEGLSKLLSYFGRLAEDGTLDKWAQNVSDKLSEWWDWGVKLATDGTFERIGNDIKEIGKAAWIVAKALASAVNAWSQWRQSVQDRKDEAVANSKIGAVSIGGVRLWGTTQQERDEARARLNRTQQSAAGAQAIRPVNDNVKWPGQLTKSLAAPAAKVNGVLKPGSKAVAPWTPRTSGSSAARQTAAPKQIVQTQRVVNDVKVGGGVEVSVRAAPGLIASTTRLSSSNRNVPLTAKTGKAMSEAA